MYQVDSNKETYSLGTSLTIEALKSIPKSVKRVFLSSKANRNSQLAILLRLCEDNNIEVIEDDSFINKYSLKENCYCIGIIERFNNDNLGKNHIVLCGFNDIGQVGTIFRSAVSFNMKDFVLINSKIDVFDPRVVRASMGAIFHLHLKEYKSIDEYLNDYSNNIYPFIPNSKKELSSLSIDSSYSIVLSQDLSDLSNYFSEGFYIKHLGDKEPSISAISSIVFHHFYKKRLR